jgi:hypothetical protein
MNLGRPGMGTERIYSTSPHLREAVENVAAEIASHFEDPLTLIEIITLPDIGQRVILRFALETSATLALDDADALETQLRESVGEDYWATITGITRLQGDRLSRRLMQIDQEMPRSLLRLTPTSHSEAVKKDADRVRRWLDLDSSYLIWEIEMPISDAEALPVVRIIDTNEEGYGLSSNRLSGRRETVRGPYEVVFLNHNPSFSGCIKAYVAAEQRRMALNSFITRFEQQGA